MSAIAPISPRGWLTYGLGVVVIVLDQLSKYWILNVYDLPAKETGQRGQGRNK